MLWCKMDHYGLLWCLCPLTPELPPLLATVIAKGTWKMGRKYERIRYRKQETKIIGSLRETKKKYDDLWNPCSCT